MKTRSNIKIAGIATIAIAMLAVLAVLSTPAMAQECWCDVSQNSNGSRTGTVTNGEVYLTNTTAVGQGLYWEFEVPNGTVQWAQAHWYSWGNCGVDPTATFCNETDCKTETINVCYNDTNKGCWRSALSPGSHHYYWNVTEIARPGTNNITLNNLCDARWQFFVAALDNTDVPIHNGKYWVNNGFQKLCTHTTWFNGTSINTSANHTLTTFISHYDDVCIDFNDIDVNCYESGYGCVGYYYSNGLTRDTINNASINATNNKLTWDDNCTPADDYFTYIAVLAEEGAPVSYPDLTVAAIDIIPGTPRSNRNFTINATIQNVGTADAMDQFNVSLYINNDRNKTENITRLNVSNSTTVSFEDINLSKGCYTFKVVADADGNVTESAETNNASSKKSQVGYVIVVESYSDFDDLVTESNDGLLGAGSVSHSGNTYYIQNFTGNSAIENCNGDGISIKNLNTTTKFEINNCTIRNCSGSGVFLHNLSNGTINGSDIQNNTNYGINVGLVPLSDKDPKFVNITNNTINDTKTYNGINLIGFNCTVKDNNVTNNSVYGIYLFANDSKIYDNNIKYNDDYGVKLYNSIGNCVYENNFTENNLDYSDRTSQGWANWTNSWNTTAKGNYWSDWKDNSGFPSTYKIDGDANDEDKRPKGLYDFLTGENTDKWAYGYEVFETPMPPQTNNDPNNVFSSSDYSNISVDDQTFQNDTAITNYHAAHRFNFSISEDRLSVKKINVTWNGIGTRFHNNGATLYIWNFEGEPNPSYDQLAYSDTDAEVTLTEEKTGTDCSKYIDSSSGNMTVLVVQNKDSGNPEAQKSTIKTDYVRVAITL